MVSGSDHALLALKALRYGLSVGNGPEAPSVPFLCDGRAFRYIRRLSLLGNSLVIQLDRPREAGAPDSMV